MPFDTIVVKRDYTAPRFDWRIFTPEFHKPGVPQRPQRVDVQVPVRYRRRGDEPWAIGRTENLSRTGVLIRGVQQDGPAARAGLLPRDVVVEIAGKPTNDVPQLLARIAELTPGSTAKVKMWRDGKPAEVDVTVGRRPKVPS